MAKNRPPQKAPAGGRGANAPIVQQSAKGAPDASVPSPGRALGRTLLRAAIVFAAYTAASGALFLAVAIAYVVVCVTYMGLPGASMGSSAVLLLITSFLFWRIGLRVSRRWRVPRAESRRWTGCGALIGAAIPAVLTALALALDSMRLENPLDAPAFSPWLLVSLALWIVGAFGSEVVSKCILYDAVDRRYGRRYAYLAECAFWLLAILVTDSRTIVPAYLGAALTAILGCRLYERGGLRASAAMRAAFNVWTLCLFGLASSDGSVLAPLYALYHVSDAWFTGGNAGMTAGWGYVICATVAAGILFHSDLSRGLARLRRRGA